MKIIADLHSHSNVSEHAYSTIDEMADEASKVGLKALAITNHSAGLFDGADFIHFRCMKIFLPRVIRGVTIIRGAEINILNSMGNVDLCEAELKQMEIIIASVHNEIFDNLSYDNLTSAYMNALKNPYIDIFGHIGNPKNRFNYEMFISKCNEYNKIIEINNHSFLHRKGSEITCREVIELCKKYDVKIVLNSDAHSRWDIGNLEKSIELVKSVNYPEELIINANYDRLCEFIKQKRGIDIRVDK